jgi:hypothetical protein
MNGRIPPILRGLVLGAVALGLSACAVYPAGGGYGPRYGGGGWRAAPPAYAYAAPVRPRWGHGGGWGHGHGWGHHGRGHGWGHHGRGHGWGHHRRGGW